MIAVCPKCSARYRVDTTRLGPEGARLEQQVLDAARAGGVRIIGPNTSGMFNLHHKVNLLDLRNAIWTLLAAHGAAALYLLAQIAPHRNCSAPRAGSSMKTFQRVRVSRAASCSSTCC